MSYRNIVNSLKKKFKFKFDEFVNLHHHDTYSPFDGLGFPIDNANRAAELNQIGLAQTNHGNTSGLIDHFKACKENNINPIMGCEAYFVLNNLVKERKNYHITLLCKNDNGYSNLMQMISEANMTGFYYRPRIDVKSLLKYQKDLIVLSGCQNSIIYQYAIEGRIKAAENLALNFYKKLDNFYLEIQPHNIHMQSIANNFAIEMNKKHGIPLVMTIDSHYTEKKDARTQLYLRAFKIPTSTLKDYEGLYLHNRKSVIEFWKSNYTYTKRIQKAINNTVIINSMCNVSLDFGNLSKLDWGENSTKKLKKLALRGIKEKGLYNDPEYRKRLEYELDMIIYKEFEDVFLLCEDVVSEAKRQDIKIGFGRGSGVSSLVAYCLDITKVDPIEYNLLFERFMSKERKGMPDIDIDFDSKKRDKILEYIENKFPGQQAQVSNKGKYQVRNLLNDFYKLFELHNKEITKEDQKELTKIVLEYVAVDEEIINLTIKKEDSAKIKKEKKTLRKYPWLKHFLKIYNNIRYFGTHASGVAICKDITKYVSLVKRGDSFVTCYDLKDLEYLGLLKLDVLGLNGLAIVNTVEKLTGCKFDKKILNDKKIYARFANLNTNGIFQFDSQTAKQTLQKIKPTNFAELVAGTSINRPACIENGMVDDYVEGKKRIKTSKGIWDIYSKETYGSMVYQEQVMTLLTDFGKCSIEFSYTFVKAASKRDKVLKTMSYEERQNPIFIEFYKNFKKNTSLSEDKILELYFNIMRYLFNKSHAVAYTHLSVYEMWQMLNFPLETTFSLLYNESSDIKQSQYEILAVSKGILIMLPHINFSANYSIREFEGEKVIQKGIAQTKGVGKGTAEAIEEYRNKHGDFISKDHIISCFPKKILRSNTIEGLEKSGAFEFNYNKYIDKCIDYNASKKNLFKNYYAKSFYRKEATN